MDNKYNLDTQKIELSNCLNSRELGGYINNKGKTIKKGKLFRTSALTKLSDSDISLLKDKYNLKAIFDFRSDYEISGNEDTEIEGVEHYTLNILRQVTNERKKPTSHNNVDNFKKMTADERVISLVKSNRLNNFLKNLYTNLLLSGNAQSLYSYMFHKILELDSATVLWHCTQGKDRAGLASLLMLKMLDVDKEIILKDFEISNEAYKEQYDRIISSEGTENFNDEQISTLKCLTGVNVKYLEDALEIIDIRYGSLDNYIRIALKMNKDDIEKLQSFYLN